MKKGHFHICIKAAPFYHAHVLTLIVVSNEAAYEKDFQKEYHYENTPIQMYTKFQLKKKTEKFQIKNSDIFHISAQNIDCGYPLSNLSEAVLTSTHNLCLIVGTH